MVLMAAGPCARAAADALADGPGACLVKTLPVEGRIHRLAIHAQSHTVEYMFMGETDRPGGWRMVDYPSGAPVDALPVRSAHPIDMLVSPSGRLLAHQKTDRGESALVVSALDGSEARTCVSSAAFHRPLAFSPDERQLVAMSTLGNDNRLILCNAQGGMVRSWSVTTVGERAREALRLRLHGRPPWMIDFAFFSPDARTILSGRSDGQVVLWDIDGQRLHSTTLEGYSPGSMRARFGFAGDGTVHQIAQGMGDRRGRPYFVVSSLFPEESRFEVVRELGIKAALTADFAQLQATAQGLVLLQLRPSAVAVVAVPGGETIAQIPATGSVMAAAISEDGAMVAVAHPGDIRLWRLAKDGTCPPGEAARPVALASW